MALSPRDREILLGFADRIEPGDAGGHNNLGVLYFNKGLIAEAVDQFQRAIEIDPSMSVARRNVEIAYLSTGYYDDLIAALGQRLRDHPGDRAARWRLARAHQYTGHLTEAKAEFRRLLANAPDDPQVLVELGRAEKDLGNFAEARRIYTQALGLDPDSSVLHFHLGELHYHEGNSEEARRVLERVVTRAPAFAEAHHLLSFVLGDLGESERAAESLDRALELAPWLGEARAGLSIDRNSQVRYVELVGERRARPEAVRDHFLAHYHLGIAFRRKGLYDEALREFERAQERGEAPALVDQAKAEVLLVAGRDREAEDLYRAIIEESGGTPKLLNELGVTLHRVGRLDRAEACYREALSADADYYLAENNLAVAMANAGDVSGARSVLESVTRRRPTFIEGLYNLGLLALESGRRRQALTAFRAAVEADPISAAGWLGVGAVLSETGELLEARRALAKAVELAPDSAEARYRFAFLLNRLGDVDGSLRETQRALALNPFFTAPRLRLAIELHFEYAEILAPEISTDTRLDTSEAVPDFSVDADEITRIFAGLRETDSTDKSGSPEAAVDYALAEDYLSKGLLQRARAEIQRVVTAGGDPVCASILSGEIFRLQGLDGEALERFDAALERLGTGWSHRHERALMGRGWSLLSLGRAEEALDTAETVLEAASASVEAGRLRAEALLALGRGRRALESFQALQEKDPDDPGLLIRVAVAARLARRPSLAHQALTRALELDPDRIAARVELGSLCLSEGLVDEAVAQGRLALEALPGYGEAALLVADAELERGDFAAAVGVLVDLLADDPYHLDALLRLGEILLENGRTEDAMIALWRVLRFDPNSAVGWMRLGDAYMAANAVADAVGCWHRAIEAGLDPETTRALRTEIARLESELPGARRTA